MITQYIPHAGITNVENFFGIFCSLRFPVKRSNLILFREINSWVATEQKLKSLAIANLNTQGLGCQFSFCSAANQEFVSGKSIKFKCCREDPKLRKVLDFSRYHEIFDEDFKNMVKCTLKLGYHAFSNNQPIFQQKALIEVTSSSKKFCFHKITPKKQEIVYINGT